MDGTAVRMGILVEILKQNLARSEASRRARLKESRTMMFSNMSRRSEKNEMTWKYLSGHVGDSRLRSFNCIAIM